MSYSKRENIGAIWRKTTSSLVVMIALMNAPELSAVEGLSEDHFRLNYSKGETKPVHIVFSILVESLVAYEGIEFGVGTSLYLIQKDMKVTRERAEEILDHMHRYKSRPENV